MMRDGDMIILVTEKANSHIRETINKIRNSAGYVNSPDKYTWLRETTPDEVRAYFGLTYV